MRSKLLALFACALASCGGEPKWVGQYTSAGTWDLGGPLANGRTVGDSVADLLVEQVISLVGVPSLVEDDVAKILDGAVRPAVKAVVDPNAPQELAPGGSIHDVLAMSLTQVKVESELQLETSYLPGSMKGVETFGSLELAHEGKTYRFDAKELSELGVVVNAEWKGQEKDGDVLEVDAHGIEIQFGELVKRLADALVDAAGQTRLKNEVKAAVSCEQIVARVAADGQGLAISVADWSKTISNDELHSACDQAVPMIEEQVLGLFKRDSTLEVGGKASFSAASGELTSLDGFGGVVAVAPRPIAPRLAVQFTAKRTGPLPAR